MKQNKDIARVVTFVFAMLISTSAIAQTTKQKTTDKELIGVLVKQKTTDKELIGVWVMESMQFEGQKVMECGGDYNQIKVYRANGEYACAEVAIDGKEVVILPHEYGTYTFKDGKYTECGRSASQVLIDKNHFEGQWKNRHDKWRKVTDMPAKLTDYVVDKCKRKNDPQDIQALAKKYILK